MLILELLAIAYAIGWIRFFVILRGYAASGGKHPTGFSPIVGATIWPCIVIASDYVAGKKLAEVDAKMDYAARRMRDADERIARLNAEEAAAARLKEKLREVEARHA